MRIAVIADIHGNLPALEAVPDPARMGASDRYAYSQLNADHRHWLAALPTSADANHGILACHGTPTNDNQYLVEEVYDRRLVRAGETTIRDRLGDIQARVVLCGHSHQQHLIQLANGPLILNPGSVGCPSYDDPGADPHVSEIGSLHARYAVLNIIGDQVSAEMFAISYDWKRPLLALRPIGDQNGLTVYGQGGSCRVVGDG